MSEFSCRLAYPTHLAKAIVERSGHNHINLLYDIACVFDRYLQVTYCSYIYFILHVQLVWV